MTWSVVDDEEHLARGESIDKADQEVPKRIPIEDFGEFVGEGTFVEAGSSENMRCFSLAVCIDTGLDPHSCPCAVQRSVKPEAGLILKHHDAATSSGFFLMAGNLVRSQYA